MSDLAVSNDDGDVIDLSGSPPPLRRLKRTFDSCPARESDVIVISDDEVEVDLKVPLTPVRRVLSNAQINVPLGQQPVPGPSVVLDIFDTFTARVLEIIPDVSREHLRALLEEHYPIQGDSTVEAVLHVLFEDPSYPRSEKSAGKRRRLDVDEEGPAKCKVKIDYASKERPTPGAHYPALAMSQLLSDFPYIPKPHIRNTFASNRCLYAPAYFFLVEEAKSDKLPYKRKTIPSRVTGKGPQLHDAEFDKERAWLIDHLTKSGGTANAEEELKEEDQECEDGIECGCCFSKYAFDKMIQCPEAHLFCRSCCRSYAANLLGQHDPRLHCMDQSGCKEMFPESELVRFLSPKLYVLFQRVKQQKEIAAAGLEGLEECPFCEYKVVIENPDEKLFRCENTECEAVSCRACKKADHLPKSCKEVEEDRHLSVRHMIEEAMTKALMRNCPKCDKGFVKEHGCNKMTCPNCGTLSCYICRKVIIGYNHFGQPPPYSVPPDPNKCNLWDPVEQRHNNEVIEAAKKAVEEYKALHPDVSDEALNVDLPSPVRNPALHAGPAYPAPNIVFGGLNGHRLQIHLQQQQQQYHAMAQRQAAIQQRAGEIQQQQRRDIEAQRRAAEIRHVERLQRSRESRLQRAMVLRGHVAPTVPGANRPNR